MTVKKKRLKVVQAQPVDRESLEKILGEMTKDFTKHVTSVAEKAGVKIGVKVLITEAETSAPEGVQHGG